MWKTLGVGASVITQIKFPIVQEYFWWKLIIIVGEAEAVRQLEINRENQE